MEKLKEKLQLGKDFKPFDLDGYKEETFKSIEEEARKKSMEMDLIVKMEKDTLAALMAFPMIHVDGERWFSRQHMLRILKCKRTTLYNKVRNGQVRMKKIDEIVLFRLNGYL